MSFQKLKIIETGDDISVPLVLQGNYPQSDLSHLPDSQAGAVRHKSAIDAYNLGYKFGREISS